MNLHHLSTPLKPTSATMSPSNAFAQSISVCMIVSIYVCQLLADPCPSWETAEIALHELERVHLKGRVQWSDRPDDNLRKAAARRLANNCPMIAEEVVDLLGEFSTVVHHGAKNNNDLQRDLERVKAKIISFLYDITATVRKLGWDGREGRGRKREREEYSA